jgi:hypothetical protein
VNTLNEVRIYLEQRKGTIEQLARSGILPWMSIKGVLNISELCHEMGDLIAKSTAIVAIDTGTPLEKGETFYVERTELDGTGTA